MSGECEKCGEHTVGCECESICRSQQNSLFEVKDWLLGYGPIKSSIKCCKCEKGAVWEPKEPNLPYYCENHAPWRD